MFLLLLQLAIFIATPTAVARANFDENVLATSVSIVDGFIGWFKSFFLYKNNPHEDAVKATVNLNMHQVEQDMYNTNQKVNTQFDDRYDKYFSDSSQENLEENNVKKGLIKQRDNDIIKTKTEKFAYKLDETQNDEREKNITLANVSSANSALNKSKVIKQYITRNFYNTEYIQDPTVKNELADLKARLLALENKPSTVSYPKFVPVQNHNISLAQRINKLNGVDFRNGTINGTPVGKDNPSEGYFTNLISDFLVVQGSDVTDALIDLATNGSNNNATSTVTETLTVNGESIFNATSTFAGPTIINGTTTTLSNVDVLGDADISGELQVNGAPIALEHLSNAQVDTANQNLFLGHAGFSGTFNNQYNTVVGIGALDNPNTNTSGGGYNTVVGYNALTDNTTGSYNTAQGAAALSSNTTGNNNTATGMYALRDNTSGHSNTAVGSMTLAFNTTGIQNTAQGTGALSRNNTGSFNTAMGVYALNYTTSGSRNTAVGMLALQNNTTGHRNVSVGMNAGRVISDGSPNTVVNNSIFIGADTRALADNGTNEIVIGYNATGNGSNSVTLGDDNIIKTILKGNVGVGVTSPSVKLQVGTSGDGSSALANAWNTFSDKRLKKDITPLEDNLEKLLKLNAYTYKWKEGKDQSEQLGLIAQEVQEVYPEVVSEVGQGDDAFLTVSYGKLVAPLIGAIKEIWQKITGNEKRITELEKQVNELKNKISKMQNSASHPSQDGAMDGNSDKSGKSEEQFSITLNGDAVVFLGLDEIYRDQGAVATVVHSDGSSQNINVKVSKNGENPVDPEHLKLDSSKETEYLLVYSASWRGEEKTVERTVKVVDKSSNSGLSATNDGEDTNTGTDLAIEDLNQVQDNEDSNESDNIAPEITVNPESVSVEAGEDYQDTGVSAIDDTDGDLSDKIQRSGKLDTNTPGEYTITYTVADTAGNEATATRTVTVQDTTAPSITVHPGDDEIKVGDSWQDAGAVAQDAVDGDLTDQIEVSGSVDSSTAGEYIITYTVTDSTGNKAEKSRIVIVSE